MRVWGNPARLSAGSVRKRRPLPGRAPGDNPRPLSGPRERDSGDPRREAPGPLRGPLGAGVHGDAARVAPHDLQGTIELVRAKAAFVDTVNSQLDQLQSRKLRAYMTCRAVLATKTDHDLTPMRQAQRRRRGGPARGRLLPGRGDRRDALGGHPVPASRRHVLGRLAGCAANATPPKLEIGAAGGADDDRRRRGARCARHLPGGDLRAAAAQTPPPATRYCCAFTARPRTPARAAHRPPQRYRIAFVPGFLSECFDRYARPFADAQRGCGPAATRWTTSGCRGAHPGENAPGLARHIEALNGDPRLITSLPTPRGSPMRSNSSSAIPVRARIAAIVSGRRRERHLACRQSCDRVPEMASGFPLPGCDRAGEEIDDLRRDMRLQWWRSIDRR